MAQIQHLIIDQGSSFLVDFDILGADRERWDLTGYTIEAKMRREFSSDAGISITCTISSPATDGIFTLSMTSEETEALVPERYVYDVELIDEDGEIERILEGIVTVKPNATKIDITTTESDDDDIISGGFF